MQLVKEIKIIDGVPVEEETPVVTPDDIKQTPIDLNGLTNQILDLQNLNQTSQDTIDAENQNITDRNVQIKKLEDKKDMVNKLLADPNAKVEAITETIVN